MRRRTVRDGHGRTARLAYRGEVEEVDYEPDDWDYEVAEHRGALPIEEQG